MVLSEENVFTISFVESATNIDGFRHFTPKVRRNGFCPVHFLSHGNGSPDEILSLLWNSTIGEIQ